MPRPKKKHEGAVALALLRAKSLTPERRKEISEQGVKARQEKTTPEQRKAIGQKAAAARWGKKKG